MRLPLALVRFFPLPVAGGRFLALILVDFLSNYFLRGRLCAKTASGTDTPWNSKHGTVGSSTSDGSSRMESLAKP